MEEVEIKVIGIDRKEIIKKLIGLGAKKEFEGDIHAISFDFPDKSIRSAARTLRLRTKGSKTFLTFKAPVENSKAKIRHEHEVEVSNFGIMKTILSEMNLKQWREIKKHRTSYRMGDALFEFDKYKGEYSFIPEFMEIEILGRSHEKPIKLIYKYAEKLGLKKSQCTLWTLNDLIRHYKK